MIFWIFCIQTLILSTVFSSKLEHKPIEDDSDVPCVLPFKYQEETFHNCSNILYESEHGQCGTSENINIGRRFKNCTVFDDLRTPGVPHSSGCVFPFLYEGIVRNDCIFEDVDDAGWCSRTNNYDRDRNQTQCWKTGDEITEEFDPQPCVFPFIFKNSTYDKCHFLWDDVFVEHGHCGTTGNMNIDRRYKSCSGLEKIVTTSTTGYSECVFPFLYEQNVVNNCIFDGSHDNGWCSGTNNYDRDQIKKPCWKTTDDEVTKDAADVPCFYPFQYKNKTYNNCIHMFGESPYGQCGTTNSVNVDRRYKDCSIDFDEPRGTPGPSGCIFPFLYQGKTQNTCIYTNEEPGWCSLSNNYDRDGLKKLCWEEDDPLTESPEFSACVFPFKYKNRTYKNCTDIVFFSEHGQCATESNDINVGRTYRNCTNFDPISLNTVVQDYDVPCHFPFIFKNKVYNECAPLFQDTKYGQCATTSNMDISGRYRNCKNVIGCHFPFVYQNKTYNDCIFNSFNDGWCSRTDNYDRDGLKKMCFDPGYQTHFTEGMEDTNTDKCHFPYTYRNRVLNSCINHLVPGQKFICATTSSLNRDRKFKFCNQEEVSATLAIRTHNNKTCVFPFKAYGATFHGCTEAYRKPRWCEAVGDDGRLSRENCLETPNSDIIIRPVMYTYTDEKCIFPFRFHGVWHHGCTTIHHPDRRAFCATTDNRLVTKEVYGHNAFTDYDLCVVEENAVISTYGGNGGGKNCHFPFREGDVMRKGCLYKGSGHKHGYWCATTSDYTTDKLWGYCNMKNTDTELKRISKKAKLGFEGHRGLGFTIFEGTCRFPFTYNGQEHHGCYEGDSWWCAKSGWTKTNHWHWAICDEYSMVEISVSDKTSKECTYPFVYNGKVHSSLLVAPTGAKPAVCSTTANYDRDRQSTSYFDP